MRGLGAVGGDVVRCEVAPSPHWEGAAILQDRLPAAQHPAWALRLQHRVVGWLGLLQEATGRAHMLLGTRAPGGSRTWGVKPPVAAARDWDQV